MKVPLARFLRGLHHGQRRIGVRHPGDVHHGDGVAFGLLGRGPDERGAAILPMRSSRRDVRVDGAPRQRVLGAQFR